MTTAMNMAVTVAAAQAATVLVLCLTQRTRRHPSTVGRVETVPVGLLLGIAAVTPPEHAVVVAPVVVIGGAAAVVDAHERRLPNALTAGVGLGLLVAIPATSLLCRDPDGMVRAAVAAVATALMAVGVKAARPAMLGWGDVKLLPSVAAALAWAGVPTLLHGLVLWTVLLLVTAVVWRVGRFDATDTVPYGPALVIGTLGALLVVT